RRLEDERPDGDPAARAVDPLADRQHAETEDERRHDEGRRERAEALEWKTRDDDEQSDADGGVDHLLLDEAEWVRVAERRGSGGRAVHHDEPEENKRRRDEH